jgi:hypothetical protein
MPVMVTSRVAPGISWVSGLTGVTARRGPQHRQPESDRAHHPRRASIPLDSLQRPLDGVASAVTVTHVRGLLRRPRQSQTRITLAGCSMASRLQPPLPRQRPLRITRLGHAATSVQLAHDHSDGDTPLQKCIARLQFAGYVLVGR